MIHNLKSGALDRYGLGAAELVAAKPSLVCCNLGAFGAIGPLRDRPGYDPMMQAYSGLMSLLGEDGRPPVRVSVSIVDMAAGMWSVIGILAALQERGRTGRGGIVDTSLYETALAWMSIPLAGYLADGKIPARHGSGVDMIVPYQAFDAADGYMMVAAGNDNLFRRLCAALGRPELAEDARFRSNKDRVVHRAELVPILAAIFATKTLAHWADLLEGAGIPNGPINTLDQVVADPQTRALGMIQRRPGSGLGLVGLPLSFDGVRPPFAKAAPALGEDNDALARADADDKHRPALVAAALVLAALAGCATTSERAARRPARERGHPVDRAGRQVHRLCRPAAQHAEPFLGVPGTNFAALRSWLDTRTGESVAPALCRGQLLRRRAQLGGGARQPRPRAALHPDQQERDHLRQRLLLCRGVRRRIARGAVAGEPARVGGQLHRAFGRRADDRRAGRSDPETACRRRRGARQPADRRCGANGARKPAAVRVHLSHGAVGAAAQHDAGQGAGMGRVVDDDDAVDDRAGARARGIAVRLGIGRAVAEIGGVEDRDVGAIAFARRARGRAASRRAAVAAGHLADRLLRAAAAARHAT